MSTLCGHHPPLVASWRHAGGKKETEGGKKGAGGGSKKKTRMSRRRQAEAEGDKSPKCEMGRKMSWEMPKVRGCKNELGCAKRARAFAKMSSDVPKV